MAWYLGDNNVWDNADETTKYELKSRLYTKVTKEEGLSYFVQGLLTGLAFVPASQGGRLGIVHGHHSFPKYLGGAPDQVLTKMVDTAHRMLHSQLRNFEGGWLGPKKGYSGKDIISEHGQEAVIEGLKRFYKETYPHLLKDFEEAVKFTFGK